MSRGKLPKINIKAPREFKLQTENKISVSFQYLTNNNGYNLKFFGKDLRAKANFFEQLLDFLTRLTSHTLLEISTENKITKINCGFEVLEFKQIEFTPSNYTLTKDAKIHDFRFGNSGNGGDYRLLGFFAHNQTILNIIGFDFNYSAYKHGQKI